jgi:riboflavin transport system permease protein
MSTNRSMARLIALAAALVFAALYALVASSDPISALSAFFVSPFASTYAFFSLLESAAPLLSCALGASIAFRAGQFNLGGEGQAALGTLAAALAASVFQPTSGLPPMLSITMILIAAAIAGALLALLSAIAERKTGAHVMLTSFLLAQAAIIVVDWAIAGPLKDPSSNLLGMAVVSDKLRLPLLAPPSPLSAAFPISVLLAAAMLVFTKFTRPGLEMRMLGKNPAFARAIGLPPKIGDLSMAASGALAGIAGAFLVLGQTGRAVKGMTGGVGWNGLAVALVAGSDSLGTLPAALFFAWLDSGSRQASMLADLSPDAGAVMRGIALFLITASVTTEARKRSRSAKP